MVSGSWDGSARLWRIGKWECEAVLDGHRGSVWCVLAYNSDTIITGGSERMKIGLEGWADWEYE